MITHPLLILAVLGANVAASEWLARHTVLRHLGSALLVIVLTAIVANVGVIPTYSDEVPVYGGVFQYLAPSLTFVLGVAVYREAFTTTHAISFGCIWVAVALYAFDSLRLHRLAQRADPGPALEDRST